MIAGEGEVASAQDGVWAMLTSSDSVGGISRGVTAGAAPADAPSSGPGAGLLAGVIAGTAAGAVALGGAWYARRRWVG